MCGEVMDKREEWRDFQRGSTMIPHRWLVTPPGFEQVYHYQTQGSQASQQCCSSTLAPSDTLFVQHTYPNGEDQSTK